MSFITNHLINSSRVPSVFNITTALRALSLSSIVPSRPFHSSRIINQLQAISDKTTVPDIIKDPKERNEIFKKVNYLIETQSEGRLFAVIHLLGKQFKITEGDIILVEGYWPPTVGDQIRLEKVLVAGGKEFTLIGRPMLNPGLINIQATIIEKTLTHTKTHFRKKRRKQYMRINFYRNQNTMIRINSITIDNKINQNASETTEINLF